MGLRNTIEDQAIGILVSEKYSDVPKLEETQYVSTKKNLEFQRVSDPAITKLTCVL